MFSPNFRNWAQKKKTVIHSAYLKDPHLFAAGILWSPNQEKRRKNGVVSKSASSLWGTTWQPACLTCPWRRSPAHLFLNSRTKWRVANTTAESGTRPRPSCLTRPRATQSRSLSLNPSPRPRSGDPFWQGHTNCLQPTPCRTWLELTSGPSWIPWTP